MKKTKSAIAALLIAGGLTVGAFGVVAASADPPVGGPPGQGECEHGNSGQECKPDPQPDHGKDCEEHGPNEGGVNEDHCLSITIPPTTTIPPTVTETTTTAPPTETETTTTATETTTATTVTETTATEPPSATTTTTVAPPTKPGEGGGPKHLPQENPGAKQPKGDSLAYTGASDATLPLVGLAGLMFLGGLGLLRAGAVRREDA